MQLMVQKWLRIDHTPGAGNWISLKWSVSEVYELILTHWRLNCMLLMTFYDFLIRHFKKNVKSHVFLKSVKKRKIRILEHWRKLRGNLSNVFLALVFMSVMLIVYVCWNRGTVRTVSWLATSFSKSIQVSFLKVTPTSSASTCSAHSTRTTAARSTSRSSCRRSTSRRRASRNRSSSGRSRCTTSTETGRSNPAKWPRSSESVYMKPRFVKAKLSYFDLLWVHCTRSCVTSYRPIVGFTTYLQNFSALFLIQIIRSLFYIQLYSSNQIDSKK